MQTNAGLLLLVTAETADDFRIKVRKLNQFVAEAAIPRMNVTGKWRVSSTDLERWPLAGMVQPNFDGEVQASGSRPPTRSRRKITPAGRSNCCPSMWPNARSFRRRISKCSTVR